MAESWPKQAHVHSARRLPGPHTGALWCDVAASLGVVFGAAPQRRRRLVLLARDVLRELRL